MKPIIKILKIKKFIIDKKLNINKFCKLCGISVSTYYYIMKKERCNFLTLIKIADATGLSCDELVVYFRKIKN